VHNDYRIGNVVMSDRRPGEVGAVLDWELATVGDPLLDLGYFLASVPERGRRFNPAQEFGAAMLEDGYPGRDELAERYAARTGASLANLSWYTAMVLWKLAVLYEYGRRRAVRSVGDPYYRDPALVRAFLEDAHRAAGLPAPPEPTPSYLKEIW
jgi:aminoglycoside phosphotransferase (APT) family kinase protein